MDSPRLIANQAELEEFVAQVSGAAHLAVDSESNSYHAYTPRICLIQISSDQQDFIIDPLSLKDLTPLGHILADPTAEKILHAAENDLLGFKRDFRFSARNIFDTAIACRLLGRKKTGLARILSEEFGLRLDKRFQRCDWAKRPLSPEQLCYAQLDTHFLIKLRHRFHRELLERNLGSLARERFARLEKIRSAPRRSWSPDDYLNLRGAQELSEASRRALGALFAYRERLARRTDKAPFRIMNNEMLLTLAREMPQNHPALLRVRGLPYRFRGKVGHDLLRIIKKSQS